MTKANMIKFGLVVLAIAVVLVATAPKANAQFIDDGVDPTTMHINCTGTTVCSAGPTFQQTQSQLPTFTVQLASPNSSTGLNTSNFSGCAGTNDGTGCGTVYLVVVIPNNVAVPSFTVTSSSGATSFSGSASLVGTFSWTSGTRFGAIGVTPVATSDPNFSSYLTSAQLFQGSATGFNVLVFNLGNISGLGIGANGINVVFGGQALPLGTIIWSYMTNSNSTSIGINSTPNSSSLLLVPEPGALSQLLLGLGVLACGAFFARARMSARSR